MVIKMSQNTNYNIHYEERCGRMLIASRDISAGEVVFVDSPAAVGPDNNPGPWCLNCYKRLPGITYQHRKSLIYPLFS